MKKLGILCFLFFFFGGTTSVRADVQTGRDLLFNNGNFNTPGLVAAKAEFEASVQANPSDQEANFFLGITRVPALLDNTATYTPGLPIENIKELFDSFGMSSSGRDIFNWTADFTRDAEGKVVLPPGAPSGPAIQDFLESVVIEEIGKALANLSICTPIFNITLYASETGEAHDIELDYGDVLICKSFLYVFKAVLLFLTSYDMDADPQKVVDKIRDKLSNLHADLIDRYPQLLRILPVGKTPLAEAKSAVISAIDRYNDASAFIRGESDDQFDDLVAIGPEDSADEAHFRSLLAEAKQSMLQERPAAFESKDGTYVDLFDLNHLFGTNTIEPVNIRGIFPYFDKHGVIHTGTFPDTTLDGVLLDCTTEAKLVEFLGWHLPIVFPISPGTILMDGNDSDWQALPPIPTLYFLARGMAWDIEYVKLAQDGSYLYWMVKFLTPIQPGRHYSFALFRPPEEGWASVNANIRPDLTYQVSASPSGKNYSGTTADFGIGGILEGRIPLWLFDLTGVLDLNFQAMDWNVGYMSFLYSPSIILASAAPLTLTDAIRILKIMVETEPGEHHLHDINADGKIGLAELIYILQNVSGSRLDCRDSDDCEQDFYCAKEEGDCSNQGLCSPRPQVCTTEYDPVCGCNGITYGNACEAARSGVSVAYRGPCPP